ncbi:peptide ABC transporter substrate-binding protein [Streptomyces aidingensis]|uniref:Peptide/nickel transport system substrate-binding protein/oligopeptide transport system substrate-binding protein n=1 Tax=Streptomyces aidingensis TaxID=910347 RepID=A0A1I1VEV8_9ACTN|nr:ABC transporter substrate-binding protein [Streptomyces aidingensis]SFD81592.1 peptide/nickel transport system substrate-binding protein/oligopeptide transport system substrate-binding protein [Streptomyces aidingensis]
MRGGTRLATAVAGLVALALAATACGGDDGGGGGAGAGGELVRASWGEPQHPLEPANTNEVQGGKVLDMIFRGLKRYNPDTAEAENAMAESIETEDQQNFTITIEDGWTFQDGTPVTAQSYVDAWNYGAHIDNAQIGSYFFEFIDGYDDVHPAEEGRQPTADTMSGLEVVDDTTFTVRLREPFSLWPETLGYAAYAPLPQSFFDNHDAWLEKPVGNGPYLIDSYQPSRSMTLVPYEDFAGDDAAQNDGVELIVYTDNSTAYTDLQAGNLDVADDIPAAQLRNAEQDLDGRFINQPAGIIQTVSFPLYQEEWQGEEARRIRQGLSRAIDREQITRTIFNDTRTPATDFTSPVLQEAGGYQEGLCGDVCEFDADAAREMIEDAGGLPGGSVTLTSNVDTGSHREWMDAACNSINNVLGDTDACVVNPVPTFADFRNQVTNDRMTGMFRTGWQMDYPLIQNFLQPIYYSTGSSNDSGYDNPEFDALVDRANAAESEEEAVDLFQQAEELLVEDMPAIPLWYQNGIAGYSERVDNVKLNPFSVPVFTDITVD